MVKSLLKNNVDVMTNMPHEIVSNYLKNNKKNINSELMSTIKEIRKLIREAYCYDFRLMHY
jgi:uncharacterized protein YacL (UPF0231 family)